MAWPACSGRSTMNRLDHQPRRSDLARPACAGATPHSSWTSSWRWAMEGPARMRGQAIGRSGDGGVDGIIKEDRLGLDVVHIQAKRWRETVGRPTIQAFAGSLEGYRARKGVLIT